MCRANPGSIGTGTYLTQAPDMDPGFAICMLALHAHYKYAPQDDSKISVPRSQDDGKNAFSPQETAQCNIFTRQHNTPAIAMRMAGAYVNEK